MTDPWPKRIADALSVTVPLTEGDENVRIALTPGDTVLELIEHGVRIYSATYEETSCPECGHPLERDCYCTCCIVAAQAFFELHQGDSP
jgi:hypothetical protein